MVWYKIEYRDGFPFAFPVTGNVKTAIIGSWGIMAAISEVRALKRRTLSRF
jgi:hypothetical protein